MKSAREHFARDRPTDRFSPATRGRAAAFTLVGLSVVIFVVSLLVAVAVPAFRHLALKARTGAVVNDLRAFTSAFQAYATARGHWPTGKTGSAEFPASMAGQPAPANWNRPTPIGGRYTWALHSIHQGERYEAAIVISPTPGDNVTANRKQLEAIDRAIDDGSLDTGNFRLGFRNVPVFVLEH